MAHLVCVDHKKRTMVLSDGTAVHRENSVRCDSTSVRIGSTAHSVNDVLYFHAGSPTFAKTFASLRKANPSPNINLSVISKQFAEGMQRATDEIKKMGAIISEGAKQISAVLPKLTEPKRDLVVDAVNAYFKKQDDPSTRLLQDIYAQAEADIRYTKCPACGDDKAVLDKDQNNTIYCDNCDFIGQDIPPVSLAGVNLHNPPAELLRAIFGDLGDVARDTTLGTAEITSTSEGIEAHIIPNDSASYNAYMAHGGLTPDTDGDWNYSQQRKQTEADDEAYRQYQRRIGVDPVYGPQSVRLDSAIFVDVDAKIEEQKEFRKEYLKEFDVETCHCGRPATHTALNHQMDGYCDDCTSARCDVHPQAHYNEQTGNIDFR